MNSSPGTPEHHTGRLLATARTHETRPSSACRQPRPEASPRVGVLCPLAEHVAVQRLSQRQLPRVVPEVEADPVHGVGEPDAGFRVGEPERSAGAWCAERLVAAGAEPEAGK